MIYKRPYDATKPEVEEEHLITAIPKVLFQLLYL